MRDRKTMKAAARHAFKEHYGIFVIMCLIAALMGTEFARSVTAVESTSPDATQEQIVQTETTGLTGSSGLTGKLTQILTDLAKGKYKDSRKIADEEISREVEASKENGNKILGRSRGVFSTVINQISSGAFLVSLTVGISSIVGSDNAAAVILIIASLLLMFAGWVFVLNLYQVIMRRMFLEGRCYEKVHARRALFLIKVKKWFRAAITVFEVSVCRFLWLFTIIGGIIKYYSYYMVPYIVAENPSVTGKQARMLSRQMMDGHKWECFKFGLSFIGWTVLDACTFGLSGIFFSNPYKVAAYSEYYAELRRLGIEKKITYWELLDDQYLHERPRDEELYRAYADAAVHNGEAPGIWMELTGIKRFLAKYFGLTIWSSAKEKVFDEAQASALSHAHDIEALEGLIYPSRLSPIPEKQTRKWVDSMNYVRCYSIWSVIMMFFVMSFVGWVWEVCLHLVSDGVFVNRGVMHGPWLPIYGWGSVLMLLLLNRFRKNPALEFVTAVVVCGVIEYFTSYYLEIAHNGKRWWDYSGYFLNLNGRICAEGLLTFGLGGMMIVYVLAPALDNFIKRIPFKILIIVCLILSSLFIIDQAYSRKHPNEGAGITDYQTTAQAGDRYGFNRDFIAS